ncbi:hypothetical protein JYU16_00050 [bacterium AH-315-M05]|nr:hypothetical protein [bacterium AH-315-M05]
MKRIKNMILLILLVFLVSCEFPYFDRIPGKQIKEIPKELTGNYRSVEVSFSDGKWQLGDTVMYKIMVNSWMELNKDSIETFLSDSVVVSRHKSFYFLSLREDEGWNCFVIEKNKTGFIFCPVSVPEDSIMEVLSDHFSEVQKLKSREGEDDYYLVKMNEEELLKFYKKYLKKLYYFKFELSEE